MRNNTRDDVCTSSLQNASVKRMGNWVFAGGFATWGVLSESESLAVSTKKLN
jgi:hypothetical protein